MEHSLGRWAPLFQNFHLLQPVLNNVIDQRSQMMKRNLSDNYIDVYRKLKQFTNLDT